MSGSVREEHGSAFEASSYAMLQSVVPSAFERSAIQKTEKPDLTGARLLYRQTAHRPADRVVQVSPANAVTRRCARWSGMAVEIVQASRRGRIDYRYSGSMHMLV